MTELIPATCPSCGANLRLPDMPGKARCWGTGVCRVCSGEDRMKCPECGGAGRK